MKKVLVLCTGNSCRSQIAEGYLRYFAGNSAEIYSAGVESHGLNLRAVETMLEDGIDISRQSSKLVDIYDGESFDFVITVCDNALERCPIFPAVTKQIHRDFPDPSKYTGSEDEISQEFRRVRKMIRDFSKDFVAQYLG